MKIITALLCLIFCFQISAVQAFPVNPSIAPIGASGKINLNTANADTIKNSVKGIGTKRAESIIKYRNSHNGFKSIMDLASVPGLGKNFVQTHQKALEETFIL